MYTDTITVDVEKYSLNSDVDVPLHRGIVSPLHSEKNMANSKKPDGIRATVFIPKGVGKSAYLCNLQGGQAGAASQAAPVLEARFRRHHSNQVQKTTPSPTVDFEDIVTGKAVAGDTMETNTATFTFGEGGASLLLTQATDSALAKFATKLQMANVHVFLWHLTKSEEEFNPPLPGELGEKQRAMHAHLREWFNEYGIARLAEMLEKKCEEKYPKSPWVGHDDVSWNSAKANISLGMAKLGANAPAYIRLGGDNPLFGITLQITMEEKHGFVLRVKHVGARHELDKKIALGSHLFCLEGNIPLGLSSLMQNRSNGSSIEAVRNYLWGKGKQSVKFREELNTTFLRVQAEELKGKPITLHQVHPALQVKPIASKVEAPVAALLQPAKPESQPTQPVATVQAPMPLEIHERPPRHESRRGERPAQQPPAANTPKAVKPAGGNLVDFMAGLMNAGIEGDELATMVTNYRAAKAKSA